MSYAPGTESLYMQLREIEQHGVANADHLDPQAQHEAAEQLKDLILQEIRLLEDKHWEASQP